MSKGIYSEIIHNEERTYNWHNKLLILKILDGRVRLYIYGKNYVIKSGDFIVINSGTIYRLEKVSSINTVSYIYVDKEVGLAIDEEYEKAYFLCNSARYEEKYQRIYQEFRTALSDLILSLRYGYLCNGGVCTAHALEHVIGCLMRNFDFVTCGMRCKKFTPKVAERSKRIYTIIMHDHNYKLSLRDIAHMADVNYSYFRADVVSRYGYGYNWLRYTLMTERATRLLLSTNRKVSEIAISCGFSDYKYFVKYIKKFYQCTPLSFRLQFKKNYEKLQCIQ